MAASPRDTIDFTVMYATHDAFRRDLDRLATAAASGKAGAHGVRAGWSNFKRQLLIHHSVEDQDLWPRVQRAVAGRPDDLALLEEMETEHGRLDPLLDAVDEALARLSYDLAEKVRELSAVLGDHLKHEEESALPLIQDVLKPADWKGFRGAMTRRQGISGAAVYIPWITDGVRTADRNAFLKALPPPARVLNRLVWEPRYHKQKWWKF